MRTVILSAIFAAVATTAIAADPVEGEWLTPGGSAKVRIAPCGDNPTRLCGVFAGLKNPGARDTGNPDPALRGRSLLGALFIRDFKRVESGRWTGGKIYDPNSGKTYDSRMRLNGDGTLKLEGCVLVVCQAQTWKRP